MSDYKYQYERVDNWDWGENFHYKIQLSRSKYVQQLLNALYPGLPTVLYHQALLTITKGNENFSNLSYWDKGGIYAHFTKSTADADSISLYFSNGERDEQSDIIVMSGWELNITICGLKEDTLNFSNDLPYKILWERTLTREFSINPNYFIYNQFNELDITKAYSPDIYQIYKKYDNGSWSYHVYNGETLQTLLPTSATTDLDKWALLQPISKAFWVTQNNIKSTPLDYCDVHKGDVRDESKTLVLDSSHDIATNHLYVSSKPADRSQGDIISASTGNSHKQITTMFSSNHQWMYYDNGDYDLFNLGFFNTNVDTWELIQATNADPLPQPYDPRYAYVVYEFPPASFSNGTNDGITDFTSSTINVSNQWQIDFNPSIYIVDNITNWRNQLNKINVSDNDLFKSLLSEKEITDSRSGSIEASATVWNRSYNIFMKVTINNYITSELDKVSLQFMNSDSTFATDITLQIQDTDVINFDSDKNGTYISNEQNLISSYKTLAAYARGRHTQPRSDVFAIYRGRYLFDYDYGGDYSQDYRYNPVFYQFMPMYRLSFAALQTKLCFQSDTIPYGNFTANSDWVISNHPDDTWRGTTGFKVPQNTTTKWFNRASYDSHNIFLAKSLGQSNYYSVGVSQKVYPDNPSSGYYTSLNAQMLSLVYIDNCINMTYQNTYYVYKVQLSEVTLPDETSTE